MSFINKKLVGIIMLAVFLFAGSAVFAQTNSLEDPGMLPDHPLYFMKRGAESVGTFFRFGDEAKANRYLELAEKRISEANALAEGGNPELAESVLERYRNQMEKGLERAERAKEKGRDMDQVLERVSEASLKHQEVLAGIYERAPEQAREGIQRAMEASQAGGERALNSVSEERREAARENIRQKREEVEGRLEGLRQEGRPVPELPQQEIPEDVETPEDEDPIEEGQDRGQQGQDRTPEAINGEEYEEDEEEVDPEVDGQSDEIPQNQGR